jgi:DNA-binding winged helix-turn-helix (wHTH) protein
MESLRFGEFRLNPATRQLLRGAAEVHLSPKAFDLLSILVAHRPEVVTKESLRDRLWPGTNVVDANLNNLASEIRSVLDDDPQRPQFVRTVHRVGYSFCGVVEEDGGQPRGWLIWNDKALPLAEDTTLLGRDPQCAIWIDAPGVSRRHASIRIAGEGAAARASIEDLASTNGTLVDGQAIAEPTNLADGQEIAIGEATLTYRSVASIGAATKKIRRRAAD